MDKKEGEQPPGFYDRILAQAIATSREADRAATAAEESYLIIRRVERGLYLIAALIALIAFGLLF